jgi:hypothetical protein
LNPITFVDKLTKTILKFMKKLKLLYAVLFAVAIIACSKDDDDPTFKKEDFYFTWEMDDSAEQGCTSVIKIDASKIYDGEKCGTNPVELYDDNAYTFEGGNTFKVDFQGTEIKLVVKSKSATKFTADSYFAGAKVSTDSYTKL